MEQGILNTVCRALSWLKYDSSSGEHDSSDISDYNGQFLSKCYFPEEIIVNILIFLNWKDLQSCRLVCRNWKRVIDNVVTYDKLHKENKIMFQQSFSPPGDKFKSNSIPFNVYYTISKNVFGKNLLQNPVGAGNHHSCNVRNTNRGWLWGGQEPHEEYRCTDSDCVKFKHWIIMLSGGDGWEVEPEPVGCDPVPPHLGATSCFVTSYKRCKKYQRVNLLESGLTARIMDHVRPLIQVSEWYARRADCGVTYCLRVVLLDYDDRRVDEFKLAINEKQQPIGDNSWHQVSHTFQGYRAGVRTVLFEHEGMDTQYWAGHYGSKMTGGSVVLRLPRSTHQGEH